MSGLGGKEGWCGWYMGGELVVAGRPAEGCQFERLPAAWCRQPADSKIQGCRIWELIGGGVSWSHDWCVG